MKVNKFIKNIKTGVKSGMDTAVKVGMSPGQKIMSSAWYLNFIFFLNYVCQN